MTGTSKPARSAASQGVRNGVIVQWNDERGFGFIPRGAASQGSGDRVFLHISALRDRRQRPRVGARIGFRVEADARGRTQARDAVLAGSSRAGPGLLLALATAGPIAALVLLALSGGVPWLLPVFVASASLVAFALYWLDKSAARAGRSRVAEATLHFWSLVGGWPGALLAQQWFRHKTRKPPFRRTFYLTVVLNLGLFAALWTEPGQVLLWRLDEAVMQGLRRF